MWTLKKSALCIAVGLIGVISLSAHAAKRKRRKLVPVTATQVEAAPETPPPSPVCEILATSTPTSPYVWRLAKIDPKAGWALIQQLVHSTTPKLHVPFSDPRSTIGEKVLSTPLGRLLRRAVHEQAKLSPPPPGRPFPLMPAPRFELVYRPHGITLREIRSGVEFSLENQHIVAHFIPTNHVQRFEVSPDFASALAAAPADAWHQFFADVVYPQFVNRYEKQFYAKLTQQTAQLESYGFYPNEEDRHQQHIAFRGNFRVYNQEQARTSTYPDATLHIRITWATVEMQIAHPQYESQRMNFPLAPFFDDKGSLPEDLLLQIYRRAEKEFQNWNLRRQPPSARAEISAPASREPSRTIVLKFGPFANSVLNISKLAQHGFRLDKVSAESSTDAKPEVRIHLKREAAVAATKRIDLLPSTPYLRITLVLTEAKITVRVSSALYYTKIFEFPPDDFIIKSGLLDSDFVMHLLARLALEEEWKEKTFADWLSPILNSPPMQVPELEALAP